MKQPANPFIVNKYIAKEYFCDRDTETAFLKKQIDNGRNAAIISERRLGKTGLIRHYFNNEKEADNYYLFFVDLYATNSLSEMVCLLGQEVYSTLKSQNSSFVEKFIKSIASLRVGMKIDAVTGEPAFDIGIGEISSPALSLDEIFAYLDAADKPCIVAIDEFQQIMNYKEKNVEALLRTKMQQCKNINFIFSGSKRHTMMQMFQSAAKPFYQSAIVLNLQPIPLNVYTDFAVKLFEQYGKHINADAVAEVYRMYDGVTWYLQMLMNELFAMTGNDETADIDMIPDALDNIIKTQEAGYMELLSNLSIKQRELLFAIGKEGTAYGITSGRFIKKYSLGSSSSVQAAMNGLLGKDILTKTDSGYRVYDFFLAKFLQKS